MQFLYYLLIFVLVVSAIVAILMATGVLHIEVYTDSNHDNLPDEVRKHLEDESEDEKKE